MDSELYGREAIFGNDGLAARPTGLTPTGSARAAYEHRDDPPVVVLTGGRGMGKTAVLKQLRHVYREITPDAWAAEKGGAKERTGGSPADYQEFLDLLEVAWEDASRRFVAIAWPEGKPPARNCLPPAAAP
ncbi:hypothetical protein [Streptomyces sp. NPDC057909]|uniref:hypothetical protein n=1 Tax=Streptomyces sp. NPDC057909 TaxID=3346277 RepID=UPI0036E31DB8